jgi:hypothetical protein
LAAGDVTGVGLAHQPQPQLRLPGGQRVEMRQRVGQIVIGERPHRGALRGIHRVGSRSQRGWHRVTDLGERLVGHAWRIRVATDNKEHRKTLCRICG